MTDFYLETDRLIIRPHNVDDVPFMVELNSDQLVTQYTGEGAVTYEEAKQIVGRLTQQFEESRMGRFLVIDKKTDEKLGWCGLVYRPKKNIIDHGYRFSRNKWGLGYATESSIACLKYGFNDLNLSEITAEADIRNTASINVLKKLRFTIVSEDQDERGKWYNFHLSKSDFLAHFPG